MNNFKRIINILLVIIWMGVIFYFSSRTSEVSDGQSNIFVNFIENTFNMHNADLLSFIVRKIAHFTEYFILGLLVCNMFTKLNKKIIFSIVLCVLYSISDEIHQIFVPGRTFKVLDIFIDSMGSILGISMFNLIYKKRIRS